MQATELTRALAQAVSAAGFDVLGSVSADAYNRSLTPQLEGYRLPDLGLSNALVIVIGNTRRLWPLFLRDGDLTRGDPLDDYAREHVEAAAAELARSSQRQHAVRHACDPAPRAVAIQRLAALAGVGEIAPIGLCIHVQHGPWLSLRAAVVFDVPGPPPSAAAPTCSACRTQPCVARRDHLLNGRPPEDLLAPDLPLTWRDWLSLRDACPLGRADRFDDRQLEYHYTKDRSLLREVKR